MWVDLAALVAGGEWTARTVTGAFLEIAATLFLGFLAASLGYSLLTGRELDDSALGSRLNSWAFRRRLKKLRPPAASEPAEDWSAAQRGFDDFRDQWNASIDLARRKERDEEIQRVGRVRYFLAWERSRPWVILSCLALAALTYRYWAPAIGFQG